MKRRSFLVLGAAFLASSATAQTPATRTIQVRFTPGARSATLRGSVQGYDTVDYAFVAHGGQTLSVRLRSNNDFANVAVFAPGGGDVDLSPDAGNAFTGELPESGRYRVRVFIMRADARRGSIARYRLTIGI